MSERRAIEWPTLAMLVLCYGTFAIGTIWAAALWLPLGIALATLAIALHSSLTHEVLHGHPFRSQRLNDLLIFPAIGLLIPYYRFRDTHLAHHNDPILTDPYDDPESNFLDPKEWAAMYGWQRLLCRFNNTLMGRLILGPLHSQIWFMRADWRAIRKGDRDVLMGWVWHIPAVLVVVWWLGAYAQMPVWAYLLSAYAGMSLLKIRTYLEHRAHELPRARTVIVESRGPLAWLFLFNSLHVVHHTHPKEPWYRMWAMYRENRGHYLRRNEAYRFASYGEVFRRYFLRAKDPVSHPLFPK